MSFTPRALIRSIGSVTTITDNFNRANGALGTRSDGGSWTTITGVPTIASNQCQFTTAGEIAANLGHSDFVVSVDITTNWAGFPQIHLRGDGTANNLIIVYINTDGSVRAAKIIAGTTTGLIGNGTPGEFPQNTKATLQVTVSGSTISAKVNGVAVGSSPWTETQWQTQTWVGFQGSTADLFDNFSAV